MWMGGALFWGRAVVVSSDSQGTRTVGWSIVALCGGWSTLSYCPKTHPIQGAPSWLHSLGKGGLLTLATNHSRAARPSQPKPARADLILLALVAYVSYRSAALSRAIIRVVNEKASIGRDCGGGPLLGILWQLRLIGA